MEQAMVLLTYSKYHEGLLEKTFSQCSLLCLGEFKKESCVGDLLLRELRAGMASSR